MRPVSCDISDHPALKALRYLGGRFVDKAGILPFFRNEEGELFFLIAQPKARKHSGDIVPFGIPRGHRQIRNAQGDWEDIRDEDKVQQAKLHPELIRPVWETAMEEGFQEAGLPRENIKNFSYCGILKYKNYGIHFFLAEVNDFKSTIKPQDSVSATWASKEELAAMVTTGAFNALYFPILSAMAEAAQT